MRDLSKDRSLLAINSATVKPWTLEQLVEGCVRSGITAIAPWRDIVQAAGVEKAGNMIRAAGLAVSCYCRAGLFPAADEAGRRTALDDNRRAVDEAAAVGARSLVLIAGGIFDSEIARPCNGAIRDIVTGIPHASVRHAETRPLTAGPNR